MTPVNKRRRDVTRAAERWLRARFVYNEAIVVYRDAKGALPLPFAAARALDAAERALLVEVTHGEMETTE